MSVHADQLGEKAEDIMRQRMERNLLLRFMVTNGEEHMSLLQGCVNLVLQDVGDLLIEETRDFISNLSRCEDVSLRHSFYFFCLALYVNMRNYIRMSRPSSALDDFLDWEVPEISKWLLDGDAKAKCAVAHARRCRASYISTVEL